MCATDSAFTQAPSSGTAPSVLDQYRTTTIHIRTKGEREREKERERELERQREQDRKAERDRKAAADKKAADDKKAAEDKEKSVGDDVEMIEAAIGQVAGKKRSREDKGKGKAI